MMRRIQVVCLLALALAVPGAMAQTTQTPNPPASAPPAANLVDPGTIQALKDMGAHLQTLKRFRVKTEITGERVLADGQKLQHTARAELDVARPDRLRASMLSPRSERLLYFDGKSVAFSTPAQKSYSTVEFNGNLGDLAEQLQDRFGVEIPLADLFRWGTPRAPLDNIESAMNAGQDFIGDDLCDHYAIRQGQFDWQVWITAGKQPLPRKIVITSRADEARPQSVSMISWDLKPTFKDAVFKFTPPKGSVRAEIVPRKTN